MDIDGCYDKGNYYFSPLTIEEVVKAILEFRSVKDNYPHVVDEDEVKQLIQTARNRIGMEKMPSDCFVISDCSCVPEGIVVEGKWVKLINYPDGDKVAEYLENIKRERYPGYAHIAQIVEDNLK